MNAQVLTNYIAEIPEIGKAETNKGDRARVDLEWKLLASGTPSAERQGAEMPPWAPKGREATKRIKFDYQKCWAI